MRSVFILAVVLAVTAYAAPADDKGLKPYAGKLVISPDQPPSTLSELPGYLKINVAKDNQYEAFKGPPWKFHLVGWFAKPVKGAKVVIIDKANPKAPEMMAVDVTLLANGRLLSTQVEANKAVGFEAGKTYVVRMLLGKKVLAKSDLLLRE